MKFQIKQIRRGGFTLLEMMFAVGIAVVVTGSFALLLAQSAREQLRGYSNATVEEKSYLLESQITACLRGMSANMGMTPNWSSQVNDSGGNFLGYSSIVVFTLTNGAYVSGTIQFNTNGTVVFTPNNANPSVQSTWISNSTSAYLKQCYFSQSYNLDSSLDSSLIRVTFTMDDNGYSLQSTNCNTASVQRSFAVQLRDD